MNKLWDFKVGDRVFCVWPIKNQWVDLPGGFYTIYNVQSGYIQIEGIKEYINDRHFIKC